MYHSEGRDGLRAPVDRAQCVDDIEIAVMYLTCLKDVGGSRPPCHYFRFSYQLPC